MLTGYAAIAVFVAAAAAVAAATCTTITTDHILATADIFKTSTDALHKGHAICHPIPVPRTSS